MAKFKEAIEQGSDLIGKIIKEHAKDVEEGWTNTEDEKGYFVNLRLKFNSKEGGDIKVEAAISYNKDVVRDTAELVVSDQQTLPGTGDKKK